MKTAVLIPIEGISRCHCGAKYWDGDKCASCGERYRSPKVGDTIKRDDGRTFEITILTPRVFQSKPLDGGDYWWAGPVENLQYDAEVQA